MAADVDYGAALRIGFAIGCCEAITGALELPADEPANESSADSDLIGPDGTQYTVVSEAEVNEIAQVLANQTFDHAEEPIDTWADMMLFATFSRIVLALRGTDEPTDRQRGTVDQLAYEAARLGWISRRVEFGFMEQPGANEDLTGVLRRSAADPHNTWVGAVVSAASALMNISKQPGSERGQPAEELLRPLGIGSAVRENLITRLIGAFVIDEHGDVTEPNDITIPEIGACIRFGYYMQACEDAMPEEAYVELDTYAQPG